jgi:hypothetical protein
VIDVILGVAIVTLTLGNMVWWLTLYATESLLPLAQTLSQPAKGITITQALKPVIMHLYCAFKHAATILT